MILTKKDIHELVLSNIRTCGKYCGYRIDGDLSQITDDEIINGIDFKCVMKKSITVLAGSQPKTYYYVIRTRMIYANHLSEPDLYIVENLLYWEDEEELAEHDSKCYYIYDNKVCTDSILDCATAV